MSNRRVFRWTVALCAALVVATLLLSTFTGRFGFDDEGYILVSLRGWIGGHALYDDVYSQYGPAFFQIIGWPFRILGNDYVTFDAARAVTVVLGAVTALSLGLVTKRITGSGAAGLAAGVGVALCAPTGLEAALHPTHLVNALIALALLGVVTLSDRPRAVPAALLLGVTVALIALVKINLGVLVAAALFAGVGWVGRSASLRLRLLAPVALIGAVAVTQELSNYPTHFVSFLAIAALVVALSAPNVAVRGEVPSRRVVFTGMVVAGVVVWFTLRDGTGVNSLAHGVVIDPLRQAHAFTAAMTTGKMTPVALVLIFVCAVLVNSLRRPAVTGIVFVLLGVAACVAAYSQRYGGGVLFAVNNLVAGAALGWIVLRTPDGDVPASRAVLCALGVLLPLQAYPVAGAQRSAGALVFPLIGVIAITDGLRALKVERAAPVVLALAATAASVVGVVHAQRVRADASPLPLAGRWIRVAPGDAAAVPVIAQALRHCDAFYGLPGLNSFYLFARERPPTWQNAGTWMTLFDASRQREVVRDLKRVHNLCVLRDPNVERGWIESGDERPGPLRPYLESFTRRVANAGPYEVYRSAD